MKKLLSQTVFFKTLIMSLLMAAFTLVASGYSVVAQASSDGPSNLRAQNGLNWIMGYVDPAGPGQLMDSVVDDVTGARVHLVGMRHTEFLNVTMLASLRPDLNPEVLNGLEKRLPLIFHSVMPLIERGGELYMVPDYVLPVGAASLLSYPGNTIEILYTEKLNPVMGANLSTKFGHMAIRVGDRVYNFFGGDPFVNSYNHITDLPTFLYHPVIGYQHRRTIHGLRFEATPEQIATVQERLDKLMGTIDNKVHEYSNIKYNCLLTFRETMKALGISISGKAPYDTFLRLRRLIAKKSKKLESLNYVGEFTYPQTGADDAYCASKHPPRFNPTNWLRSASVGINVTDYPKLEYDFRDASISQVIASTIVYSNPDYRQEQAVVLGCQGPEETKLKVEELITFNFLYQNLAAFRTFRRLVEVWRNELALSATLRPYFIDKIKKILDVPESMIVARDGVFLAVDSENLADLAKANAAVLQVPKQFRQPLVDFVLNRSVRYCKP